ncbi:MAG: CAP domain-containing protein [Thermoleophilaceae bacterium]|nr:CAP domain-containing protein [Thermoleophilaceae bacterium]
MERTPLWIGALACALSIAVVSPGVAAARGNAEARCVKASSTVRDKAVSRLTARAALLCLMNRERRKNGLAPLAENERLRQAAFLHARWMVRNKNFTHFRPGGIDLEARLRAQGYIPRVGGWFVGENIGYGLPRRSSPADQVRFWMASPAHRANILNPRFRAAGLGVFSGTPRNSIPMGATYAIDFGSRR